MTAPNNTPSERSYTTVDKSAWGAGPWQDEPDKLQWLDAATGYDCLVVRGPSGAICGYVGLPPEHPCHGANYESVRAPRDKDGDRVWIEVHGGLTFAGLCQEDVSEDQGICHVPLPGRPDKVWWLGFDCAHAYDILPGRAAREVTQIYEPFTVSGSSYRDVGYVRREVAKLADQLVTATTTED